MKIAIITQDTELCQILTASIKPGAPVPIGDGVRLRYDTTLSLRGFSVAPYTAQMVTFFVEHIDAVATGLVVAWLYDRLKGRRAELHVGDDDDVAISHEAIRQALMKRNHESAIKAPKNTARKLADPER